MNKDPNVEKQIKKVSKERQEYLKFKPFADDLRKAESWCDLDGVLNRYQAVKNLSKMGYRKASDIARKIFGEIERTLDNYHSACCPIGEIETYSYYEGGLEKAIAELKKKYIGEDINVTTNTEDGK